MTASQIVVYSSRAPFFKNVALTDGATIAVDASQGTGFAVTIAGNRTLANPTSLLDGATYTFLVTQGSGGSRLLSYGTTYKFAAPGPPTLSTTAGLTDVLVFYYDGTYLYNTAFTKDLEASLPAPSALTATGATGPVVNLAWTRNSTDESGFQIYKKDEFGDFNQLATVGAGVVTYQDTGLDPATDYFYKVRAYRGAFLSAFSNTATGHTP